MSYDAAQRAALNRRGLVAAGLIALALVVNAGVLLFSGDVEVAEQSLDQAAQLLTQHAAQDPHHNWTILVHPPWREDLQQALRKRLPNQRVVLAPAVQDGLPAGDLVLLRAGSTPGPLGLSGRQASASEHVDNLHLQWFVGFASGAQNSGKKGPAKGALRIAGKSVLLDKIKDLTVYFATPLKRLDCSEYSVAQQRYSCPGLPEWNYVGATELEVDGQRQSCLWAHPRTGSPLVIEVPLAKFALGAGPLSLGHALTDSAAAVAGGAEINIEVLADGQPVGRFVQKNQRGYTLDPLPIPAPNSVHSLQIRVSCPRDGARHFCLDLRQQKAKAADVKGTKISPPTVTPVMPPAASTPQEQP